MNLFPHASALPEAILLPLALWFFAGAAFYLYRALFPEQVRAVYGYADLENEIGHGICALAMVSMLAPMFLPIPALVWTILLAVGALWFTARALTWGKRVPYAAKWWWDWAHVGMLAGMALMFAGITTPIISVPLALFWLWFSGYYAYELVHDARSGNKLYIGSDLVHGSMGVVMLLMTIAPSLFTMSGMSM